MTDLKRCDNCGAILAKGIDSYVYVGFMPKGSAFWGATPVNGDTFCNLTCLEEFIKKWKDK